MQRLCLVGLNHHTAPLELREKLVFDAEQTRQAIQTFREKFPQGEIVLLSTCNRAELYTSRPAEGPLADAEAWSAHLRGFLAAQRNLHEDQFSQRLYCKHGPAAMEHLFAVAASLDSMVLGETQILGQVKTAYEISRTLGAAGPLLHPLFQRAAAVGKEVHHQTPLGEGRLSVASVAVDYAKRIFDTFTDKTVLCIGAGKMSALVLQNLSDLHPRHLIVCNRDPEKARNLAARFHGEADGLDSLPDHLARADIVVSGTGSTVPLITKKLFEAVMKKRQYRPVFLIDIALPRDIESQVGDLDNVYLYNLDDLQQCVAGTHDQRSEAVEQARKIVADHARQFIMADRARELGPAIDKLYTRYHTIAAAELDRTLASYDNVRPEQRKELHDMVRRLVNKVLHEPVHTLRQSDALHGPTAQYLHALEMLFQLNDDSARFPPRPVRRERAGVRVPESAHWRIYQLNNSNKCRFYWYNEVMQLRVTNPELEQFIAQKVKDGDFPSPEAVVEDALARAMDDDVEITDADIAAIDDAAEQIARGEGIPFKEFAAKMLKLNTDQS